MLKRTRNARVLDRLAAGHKLTHLRAATQMRITSLAEAVRDLREDGHPIKTHMVHTRGGRFAEYYLPGRG